MSEIEGNIENESCSTTWEDPNTIFQPFPNPKNSPLRPQKVKNHPKIKSKSNIRIDGNMQNESCSTTWLDPKTVVEPNTNPKNSPLGPQKLKRIPKLGQIQKSELKKTEKIWVVQLHD